MNLNQDIKYKNNVLINFINLNAEEKEIVRNWRNHKSIRLWMYQDHLISPKEHAGYLKYLRRNNKILCWFVKNNKNIYIGVISLNKIDYKNRNAYLGIYTNPYKRITGAGTELIGCLKYIAFNIMCLHSLRLEVIDTNKHAKNFYNKVGFQQEGILREYVYRDNKWLDVVVMSFISNKKV